MQLTRKQIDDILAALIATDGPFDPAATWAGIFISATDNGIDTVLADLETEAVADYPRKAVTAWSTPYVLDDGSAVVDGPLMHFAPPDGSHLTTIGGWFLVNSATTGDLLAYAVLEDAVQLSSAGKAWDLVLRLVVDPAGRWSAEVSFGS